jgi:hypothetical protein
MKSIVMITLAFVLLIPLTAFAQESLNCPPGAYHGLDNAGNDACRDVQTNQIVESLPKPIPESKINSPSSLSKIITFSDDSTPLILLVGMVVIGVVGISAFKIIGKNNLNKQKQKEVKKTKERIKKDKQKNLEEEFRLKKIHDERQKHQEQEDREGDKIRQYIIEEQKRKKNMKKEQTLPTNKALLDWINEDKRQKEVKEEKEKKAKEKENKKQEIIDEEEFQEKIKNNETLYDYAVVESIQDTASLRIFYDSEKKSTKYWNETGLLDRIHFKDEEIKEELKITQNKITMRISVESGGKHKFAKLISGGSMDFWDHDIGGYNLQIHFSKPEEFLKAVMMKHIRASLSKVQIHDSEYSISAILVRQDADYDDASNILKRIIHHFCDEMLETGDILVEKK